MLKGDSLKNLIEIDLDNRDEYIDSYDDKKINPDLSNYIIYKDIDIRNGVVFNIKFNYKVSELEKQNVKKMLYDSFNEGLNRTLEEIKKLNLRDFMLFGFGCLFLVIYWWLDWYKVSIFSEFFLVMGWVSFWEIAEDFLFLRPKHILKKRKYCCFLRSDIVIK